MPATNRSFWVHSSAQSIGIPPVRSVTSKHSLIHATIGQSDLPWTPGRSLPALAAHSATEAPLSRTHCHELIVANSLSPTHCRQLIVANSLSPTQCRQLSVTSSSPRFRALCLTHAAFKANHATFSRCQWVDDFPAKQQ